MTQDANESSNRLLINKKRVRNAQLIKEFIESDVYKDIISKDIDDMIESIGGYKSDGFWKAGSIAVRDIGSDTLRYLSGYQAGLVELSMKLNQYIIDGQRAERQMSKHINEEGKPEEYVNPMESNIYEGN